MMTIDEAIKHCEEVAEKYCEKVEEGLTADDFCDSCASEHRQLAEWLKELKKLKTEHKGKWINNKNADDAGEGYFICSNCKNDVYDVTAFCPNCGADMTESEEQI